ncbi:MAG: hypothetical protein GVY26_00105 [Bacteroidetes bacterium]|jgi:hypothetical protein|nr:hypothetical protein [Bacteroidota bacterium]
MIIQKQQIVSILFCILVAVSVMADTKTINVDVTPGKSLAKNVGCGFESIVKDSNTLIVNLTCTEGAIEESVLVEWADGQDWSQVDGSPTKWRLTGVAPWEEFFCVIKCKIVVGQEGENGAAGAAGGGGEMWRWMSVSDVDCDIDADNDSTASFKPASQSDTEDKAEFPGDDAPDCVPGVVIGVNNDHDEYLPEGAEGWNNDKTYHEDNALRLSKDVKRTENNDICVEPAEIKSAVNPKKSGKLKFNTIPSSVRVFHYDTKEKVSTSTEFTIARNANWDKAFYVEGLAEGACQELNAHFIPDRPKDGQISEDRFRVTVAKVDIDVDSNNNIAEDYNDAEELLEAATTEVGMIVPREPLPANPEVPIADLPRGKIHKLGSAWTSIEDANLNPVIKLKKISGSGAVKVYKASGAEIQATDNLYETLSNDDLSLRFLGVTEGPVVMALEATVNNGKKAHVDKINLRVTKPISWAPSGTFAYVWEPCEWHLSTKGADKVCEIVDDYGWNVTLHYFRDNTGAGAPDSSGTCSLENFKSMKYAGLLIAHSHGSNGAFCAVYFDEEINAKKWMHKLVTSPQGDDQKVGDTITTGANGICETAATETYEEQVVSVGTNVGANQVCIRATPEDNMAVVASSAKPGFYFVNVEADWFDDNWSTMTTFQNAIIWIMSCHSTQGGNASVAYKAGGRVRLGYPGKTDAGKHEHNAELFFNRIVGKAAGWDKKKRTAGEVFAGGGFQGTLQMLGEARKNWTTLHPAPLLTFPDSVASARTGSGGIVFDTFMDYNIAANQAVVKRSGSMSMGTRRWFGYTNLITRKVYGVSFDFYHPAAGTLNCRAVAEKCRNAKPALGRRMSGDLDTYNTNQDWGF